MFVCIILLYGCIINNFCFLLFWFSSRRRHTRGALVTGVQTCALPIWLRDRHVGAALRLMHGQPAQAWTLDVLAREVGLSRSAFAERFTRIMGTPVMQYLGKWRLQLAANLLGRPGMKTEDLR